MIQAHAIYKHRVRSDYLRTGFLIHDETIWTRPLTRDLNVPGGFVQEDGAPVQHIPRAEFERDWEFIKPLR